MIAFTYLPGFVTMIFHGMPTVWRGRHRLILCWLVFMQAVHPGRHTLAEMARWTPAAITAWRFGRLLQAAYWNVHLLVSWLAQDLMATLPAPANGILYLLWRWQPRRQTWRQEFGGAEGTDQPASSLVFWPALRPGDGGVGRLSCARKLSAHSA